MFDNEPKPCAINVALPNVKLLHGKLFFPLLTQARMWCKNAFIGTLNSHPTHSKTSTPKKS